MTGPLAPVRKVLEPELDCIIVGAGLAGAAAAAVLGRAGVKVALVDPQPICSPAFKAEKLEPDQAGILRRLGLLAGIAPHASRIHAVEEAHRGRVFCVRPIEQYGIAYPDLVNAVRRQIPPEVELRVARVIEAVTSDRAQTVVLDNGAQLSARLLILAAGTALKLHEMLGIERRMVREAHSLSSGFDVMRADGRPFPFEALTCYPTHLEPRIDYLSVFAVPGRMRVNLFSYREPKDPWVHELAHDARATLDRDLPGLSRLLGDWKVASRVLSRPVDLYSTERAARDGVVLVGDASQSVCPATGTGLTKVLTDVEVLCASCLPGWLRTPGMSAAKLASYVKDPRKAQSDRCSIEGAEYRRRLCLDRSISWALRRRKNIAARSWAGLRDHLRPHDAHPH